MNNIFDFKRFSLLLRRQWISFGKIYLISLAVVVGVVISFYGFYISEEIKEGGQNWRDTLTFRPVLFVCVGLLFLTMMSSSYFSDLGQKSKAIIELLIPASRMEKYLSSIVYTVVLTIGSYMLVFSLIDMAFLAYIRSFATATTSYVNPEGTPVMIDHLGYFFSGHWPRQAYYMLFVPFLLNSAFLLGSIYFLNAHYIKTAISLLVYVGCWIGIMSLAMHQTSRETIWIGGGFWRDEINVLKFFCAAGVLLSIAFWFLSYLRLKEKEV
ncbi:hypothetical protein [Sphingobacterium pedocola]|uniref:ABC transporter permease n=1 Tax=Sphingobacterium pedocola TaxID=2082722 RepID=A0ABR9T6X2_9SPHI|nr:hypothetical protein [Sphingobacterium pedocola]MBE8721094.1 hypothetical protein [Sphingobacterium pedocola]